MSVVVLYDMLDDLFQIIILVKFMICLRKDFFVANASDR